MQCRSTRRHLYPWGHFGSFGTLLAFLHFGFPEMICCAFRRSWSVNDERVWGFQHSARDMARHIMIIYLSASGTVFVIFWDDLPTSYLVDVLEKGDRYRGNGETPSTARSTTPFNIVSSRRKGNERATNALNSGMGFRRRVGSVRFGSLHTARHGTGFPALLCFAFPSHLQYPEKQQLWWRNRRDGPGDRMV